MTSWIERILEHQQQRDHDKRVLQELSSRILTTSKRAIFALQRADQKGSEEELVRARAFIQEGQRLMKGDPMLAHEGPWRAALEEGKICRLQILKR